VLGREAWAEGIAYVRDHPEVRDVLVSGGDPLLLVDERLDALLGELRSIPHVEMLRIGTRVPVTLPMRVTDDLARLLRRHAPLFVVTHFNHPKELTPEAREACERLVDQGVPVENQSVLMRRVNSDARIIKELNHALLRARVRPYYLHQMDVAEGLEHFRTPLSAGVAILEQLRGHTTGLAVPHLAVDLPGGGGKVTLQPEYVVERAGTRPCSGTTEASRTCTRSRRRRTAAARTRRCGSATVAAPSGGSGEASVVSWIRFDDPGRDAFGLGLGCGVDGVRIATMPLALLRGAPLQGPMPFPIIASTEDVDIRTLDRGHVVPNMLPPEPARHLVPHRVRSIDRPVTAQILA
jgi:hypothetical protein